MKLKTLFIILILVIASVHSVAQSDTKEIEKLQKQREELSIKLQQKESKLETAKPIAAKRLSKQIDKITEQVALLDSQIYTLQEERLKIYLQQEVTESSIQPEDEMASQKHLDVSRANESEDDTSDITELPEILQPKDFSEADFEARKEETIKEDISHESQEATSAKEDDDPVGTTLFAIGVAFLLFIILLLKRERCPHCGKKGTLKSLGDTRKYQYDERGNVTRTGVLKRYKCSHCGNYVEKIKWS